MWVRREREGGRKIEDDTGYSNFYGLFRGGVIGFCATEEVEFGTKWKMKFRVMLSVKNLIYFLFSITVYDYI